MLMAFSKISKNWFRLAAGCGLGLVVLTGFPVAATPVANPALETRSKDEPPVSVAEVRYEKLMKIYLNKVKLAFSETDDARSLEIRATNLWQIAPLCGTIW